MFTSIGSLSGKTLVITGATSGVGLVTARMAARAGARVFMIARNAEALTRVCEEIWAVGADAAWAVADVGDPDQVRAAAQEAISRFGGFDAWINVAGVAIYAPLLETPLDEHERLFRTNYWGVVNAAAAAIPHLKQHGGAFITVGSVVSDLGTPLLGAYAASKHAVKGFVDSLRIEMLAERAPVCVTLIKPSGVGTPLAEHARNHMGAAARVPPPAYAPELVAEAILHAVRNRRREIVVGGVGKLQILGATHLPALVDRISALIAPLLRDRSRPPERWDNLFEPGEDGRTRSRHQPSRRISLYTTATLHRGATAATAVAGAVVGGVMLAALLTRRGR